MTLNTLREIFDKNIECYNLLQYSVNIHSFLTPLIELVDFLDNQEKLIGFSIKLLNKLIKYHNSGIINNENGCFT